MSAIRPRLRVSFLTNPSANRRSFHRESAKLDGNICLITGASRGIGFAIAERFAREGAICHLVGRDRQTLESARAKLVGQGHQVLAGSVTDIRTWQQIKSMVRSHCQKHPLLCNRNMLRQRICRERIDVLVNAAGITFSNLLVTSQHKRIQEVLQTNLEGSILGCKHVLKPMLAKKEGCIINISSLAAIKGGVGSVTYSASKAGLLGM